MIRTIALNQNVSSKRPIFIWCKQKINIQFKLHGLKNTLHQNCAGNCNLNVNLHFLISNYAIIFQIFLHSLYLYSEEKLQFELYINSNFIFLFFGVVYVDEASKRTGFITQGYLTFKNIYLHSPAKAVHLFQRNNIRDKIGQGPC